MAIIDDIYDGLTDDEVFAGLPARLAGLVGARSSTLQSFASDGALQSIAMCYFTPEMLAFYSAGEWYRHDPWVPAASRRDSVNRPTSSSDLLSMDSYLKSEFYNNFFRKFGDDTGHCIGCIMPDIGGAGGIGAMGVHRALDDKPFSAEEVALIKPLVPHVRRLFEVRARLADVSQRQLLSQAALDAQPQAIFITDEQGRPLLFNRAAQALVKTGDALELRTRRLRAAKDDASRRLADAIAMAGLRREGFGTTLSLPRRSGRQALRALVMPWTVGERTRVLIVIELPRQPDDDLPGKLIALYGLTASEAVTVAALYDGQSPAQAAEARSVTLATIRTQIQQALRKTDASGIPDLMKLVATLPRVNADQGGDEAN